MQPIIGTFYGTEGTDACQGMYSYNSSLYVSGLVGFSDFPTLEPMASGNFTHFIATFSESGTATSFMKPVGTLLFASGFARTGDPSYPISSPLILIYIT